MDWVLGHRDGLTAVIQVAIDESGTHEDARALCVSGCVATSRQWALFLDEWVPMISGLDKPYHAKDSIHDSPGGLNDQLLTIMMRRMDLFVSVAINEDEYRSVVPHDVRSAYLGAAYRAGVILVAHIVSSHYRRQGKYPPIAFVIEAGHKNLDSARDFLEGCIGLDGLPCRVHSVATVGKSDPIVHPADLVAHEHGTAYVGSLNSRMERLMRSKGKFYVIAGPELDRLSDIGVQGNKTLRALRSEIKAARKRSRRLSR